MPRSFVPSFILLLFSFLVVAPGGAQPLPASDDFNVNTYTKNSQSQSAVGMAEDGDFVVVWTSFNSGEPSTGQDGDLGGIYGQRFDDGANPVGSEFQVNSATTGNQHKPAILVHPTAGSSTILWQSPDGSGSGIFGRLFSATSTPLHDEFQLNSQTTGDQEDPSIAVVADGFVAVWSDEGNGSTTVRIGRIDGGTGAVTLESERTVTGDGGRTDLPDVDSAADGSFVVVYQDIDASPTFANGVGGQRFDASAMPIGGTFRVNTYTTGFQSTPAVAVADDGNFVVVWADSARAKVLMRRYASDGTPKADEETAGVADGTYDLRWPDVVMNANGSFLIIWETFNETLPGSDFSGSGVAGRLFAANGNPIGPKFRVNNDIVSSQRNPALGADGAGNYVMTWDQSSGQDGDADGIEGRLFGPPLSASTTTTTTTTVTTTSTLSTTTTSLPPMSCADATGDGRITATDALAALRAAVGIGFCDLCLCDINNDGAVTTTDALMILFAAVTQTFPMTCPAC